jgi:peptide/nickel transport system permease protein
MLVPIVLGVATLVFFLIHMVPGDPVDLMLGETAQSADKQALREALHLNDPLHVQYLSFMKGLATADLGESLHFRQPVIAAVAERFPYTLVLTIVSMIVAILIALPAGVISAVRQYSIFDNLAMVLALAGVSLPRFWFGPLLILAFSLGLGLFPVSGAATPGSIVLPAITLGTALAALLSRQIRSGLLEVLQAEYITTARAKGLTERVVIFKHALRNALTPVITVLGIQFGALLSGAIITETIFSWPGLGRLLIEAINARDYPLVQGCVLVISFSYVIVNLLTDIAYAAADPRIRLGE